MNKFFKNIVVKLIILTILPLVYSLSFPQAFTSGMAQNIKERWIIVSCATLILHILALVWYGKNEEKQNKEIANVSKNRNELNSAKVLINVINKVIRDNANMFHELVYNKKGHSDIQDWHIMENKGDEICKVVYEMVVANAEKGLDFSVSMMFKKVENGTKGFTMLSRISYDIGHNPRTYRNFLPEVEADGFYYKEIFDKSPTKPQILSNRKEIEKNFKDSAALNYSQYIALPITCKNNKIVGILQIVSYNESRIAKNKKELFRLSNEYFSACATLMLLCDKYENVQQILK